jgi:MFS family permease
MGGHATAPSETSPLLAQQSPISLPNDDASPSPSGTCSPRSSDTSTDNDDDEDEEHVVAVRSPTKVFIMLTASLVAMFLVAVDHTILATLSGPVSTSVASMAVMPYLGAIFTATMTPSLALTGRLSDIFGRGRLLCLGVTTIGLGTLMCGLAPAKRDGEDSSRLGVAVFLAGRVVAGIGAGPAITAPALLTGDVVAPESRGFVNGIASMTWGVGCILGAFIGGAVNDAFGWRIAFLGQVPICAVIAVVSYLVIDIPPRVSKSGKSYLQRIDFRGAFLTALWLVLFQAALNAGGVIVPWSHPLIPTLFALSAVAFAAFIRVELRAKNPIIPIRAFMDRTVLMSGVVAFLGVLMYCLALYNFPLMFQVIADEGTTRAGLRLFVMSLGTIIAALLAGVITNATGRYVPVGLCGMAIAAVGFAMMSRLSLESIASQGPIAFSWANLSVFVSGFGLGVLGTVTSLAAFAASPPRLHAVVQTSVQLFREVGSTFGIATSAAVLENLLRRRLWEQFGHLPDAQREIDHILDAVLEGDFPAGWKREDIVGAFLDGFRGVWVMGVGVGILGFIAMSAMREHPLK